MRILFTILYWALHLYSLVLLARSVLGMLFPQGNKWTALAEQVTEPVLAPVRKLLRDLFPNLPPTADFSPLAVILLIQLLELIVARLT